MNKIYPHNSTDNSTNNTNTISSSSSNNNNNNSSSNSSNSNNFPHRSRVGLQMATPQLHIPQAPHPRQHPHQLPHPHPHQHPHQHQQHNHHHPHQHQQHNHHHSHHHYTQHIQHQQHVQNPLPPQHPQHPQHSHHPQNQQHSQQQIALHNQPQMQIQSPLPHSQWTGSQHPHQQQQTAPQHQALQQAHQQQTSHQQQSPQAQHHLPHPPHNHHHMQHPNSLNHQPPVQQQAQSAQQTPQAQLQPQQPQQSNQLPIQSQHPQSQPLQHIPPQQQPPSQQQQQPQPPPPPPQQQQQAPPTAQPPHHMIQPRPMMMNQQYSSPNYMYPLAHPFVPQTTGHVPPFNPTTEPVTINSQQPPVSISSHHPGLSMPQMPAVMSTATTGANNIHHVTTTPMMDHHHLSGRPPLNQPTYMIPYMQGHYNLVVPYPPNAMVHPYVGGQLAPPPNPTMLPQIKDIGIRPPYDPQNLNSSMPSKAGINQAAGLKPHTVTSNINPLAAQSTPITPIKPRERVVLQIVDPKTKHVYTEDELKSSTSLTQERSKDPESSKNASQESTLSNEDSSNNVIKKSSTNQVSVGKKSDTIESKLQPEERAVSEQSKDKEQKQTSEQSSQESKAVFGKPKSDTNVDTVQEQASVVSQDVPVEKSHSEIVDGNAIKTQTVPVVNEKKSIENGELQSDIKQIEDSLSAKVNHLSLSAEENSKLEVNQHEKKIESSTESKPAPPKSKLHYEADQFSPSNPQGHRKYSIEFCKAVFKELNLGQKPSIREDFLPHFIPQTSSMRDYSPQSLARRSSQQAIVKPRKVIDTHSLLQEVELKTADKPWKPELSENKPKILDSSQMDNERLIKVFRGHLNKLTPQKYDDLILKISDLDLNGDERLKKVIDLVFDKAVDEPGFCELYAKMCKVIAVKDQQFNHHLVRKCQAEFEKTDLYHGINIENRRELIEKEQDQTKRKLMAEELYEDMRLRRKKYLGTIKLIGEMYKYNLLLPKIIGLCITHLLSETSNENLECLCGLITTVGAKMASEADEVKGSLKNTLSVLNDIVHHKKTPELFTLESRIKFKILDTIDLSRRSWKPRMVENNPKKIEEIRGEAKEEFRLHQHNHSGPSKNLFRSADDRNRRGLGGGNYPISRLPKM